MTEATAATPIADLHPGDVICWAGASGDGATVATVTETDGGYVVTIVWHSPRTDQWHRANLNWREMTDTLYTIRTWAERPADPAALDFGPGVDPEADEQEIEGPTCRICDGLGHGYPGAGPCPLESPDPGYYADEMAAGR